MFTAKLEGLDSVLKSFSKYDTEAIQRFVEITGVNARQLERKAKRNAPVDTGDLRKNIKSERTGLIEHTITSYVPYSSYVEYGTTRQNAQPYMRPAFVRQGTIYLKDLRFALKELAQNFKR